MSTPNAFEQEASWFSDHYEDAVEEIVGFLDADGISLEGKHVADVGCGSGIMDLGLAHRARPARLVGFDIKPTDVEHLRAEARRHDVSDELPDNLEFITSQPRAIPAPDGSFDVVISWSTFEHVEDPTALASEIARILERRRGVLFLQLWPLYRSAHGSHLWTWYPDGWAQLRHSPEEIERTVAAAPELASPEWTAARLADFRSLNGLTLDGLQRALEWAGLRITKLELMGEGEHLPLDLEGYRAADLIIEGVKLTAVRWPLVP